MTKLYKGAFGSVAVLFLMSATAVGCVATGGDTSATPSAEGQAEQAFGFPLPGCDTVAEPDATMTDGNPHCGYDSVSSTNDQYNHGFCDSYVVDFTSVPRGIEATWDHSVHSVPECEALRVSYTLYSQMQTPTESTWVSNGTARFHGVWNAGWNRCSPVLDAGSSEPSPTLTATRWRVSARAYERNCGGSSCYNDKKRVRVQVGLGPC